MSCYKPLQIKKLAMYGLNESMKAMRLPKKSEGDTKNGILGTRDKRLARALIKAGDDHAKAIRGIICYLELEMQTGFMIEFETYRHGVECLSTSSAMYSELLGLKGEQLAIEKQKGLQDKIYKRIIYISYQTLRRIYLARKNHRHPDWKIFCNFIETLDYFNELIIGK